MQNLSIPYLSNYLSITCPIIHKYRTLFQTSRLEAIEIAEKILVLRNPKNDFATVTVTATIIERFRILIRHFFIDLVSRTI